MILFADENMKDDLKHIWKECFNDEDEYINFYFNNCFKNNKTLVWIENNKPVSMIILFKSKIILKNELVNGYYIYAVSTLKAYRNKGISTKLINYANKNIISQNEFTFLVPASNSLFKFYEKKGYEKAFKIKEAEILPENNKGMKISTITSKEYKKLRDEIFFKSGYIVWDKNFIDYAIKENEFNGGFTVKVEFKGKEYAAMCYKHKDTLFIKESVFDDLSFKSCAAYIGYVNCCKNVKAVIPFYSKQNGIEKYFGMIYGSSIKDGYLNLALN